MGRKIIDDLAYARVLQSSLDLSMLGDNEFNGTVDSVSPKIRLNSSKLGIAVESPCKRIRQVFDMFGPKTGECQLILYNKEETGSVTVEISNVMLRVLKALCYEQLSVSEEYSRIISSLYYELVKCLINHEEFNGFEVLDSMSVLERVIRKYFSEFVLGVI